MEVDLQGNGTSAARPSATYHVEQSAQPCTSITLLPPEMLARIFEAMPDEDRCCSPAHSSASPTSPGTHFPPNLQFVRGQASLNGQDVVDYRQVLAALQ